MNNSAVPNQSADRVVGATGSEPTTDDHGSIRKHDEDQAVKLEHETFAYAVTLARADGARCVVARLEIFRNNLIAVGADRSTLSVVTAAIDCAQRALNALSERAELAATRLNEVRHG